MPIKRKTPLRRSKRPLKRLGKATHRITPTASANRSERQKNSEKRHLLDKQWQESVCKGKSCAVCGSRSGLSGHHIIYKSQCHGLLRHLRHDVRNGVALCIEHHRWAHEHPASFENWIELCQCGQWSWLQEQKRRD